MVIRNAGQQVAPVELQVTYSDGSTQLLKYPVEIWYKGDRYNETIQTDKTVVAATVNPDGTFPDVNAANNGWRSPSAASTP